MSHLRSRRISTVAALTVPLIAIATVGSAAASTAKTVRHVGTKPAWATAAHDRGHVNGSDRVDFRVWIALRSASDAAALAAAVSNPHSAQFGRYLTTAQFKSRFGQTAGQSHAVASWLKSAGLKVTETPASHQYVGATGSVAQVAKALHTSLDNYAVGTNIWRAPANNPAVPSSLAASIAGFTGLDTASHFNHPAARPSPPPAGFRNAPPLSAFYGEKLASDQPQFDGATLPYAVKGYTPLDFRSAYGLTGDGAGTTIAITDAYFAPTILSDVNTYVDRNDAAAGHLTSGANYFETDASSFNLQQKCDASGWQGEETLDIEVAHGVAPAATIKYYGASNCDDPGLLVALNNAATDPDVDVVTNSWSGIESTTTQDVVNAYTTVFNTGIDTGKSFLFSSGDDGDEQVATGTKQVDYPSSDPHVIAVGGTSVGIDANGAFVGQSGWGTEKATLSSGAWGTPAFLYGSGGGCSVLFPANPGQSGVTDCGSARGVPDISLDGDPTTGMLEGETQTFPKHQVMYDEYRIGGTSLSSPLFAGVLALVDQAAHAAGGSNVTGPDVLYTLSSGVSDVAAQGGPGALPDAGNVRADYVNGVDASKGIVYSVRTFGQDSSLSLGTGWDQTTGLGTPNGGFVAALAAAQSGT